MITNTECVQSGTRDVAIRVPAGGAIVMTEAEYRHKLDELDRLLNDPKVPLDASRVWSLLFETAPYTAKFRSEAEQACES